MAKVKEEWYVIVNPHAGSGKTMFKWIPAEDKLKELGVPFYTVFTTHKHHAASLAASAARQGYRKIMAVGGDGSIHEVFNGIASWCEESGTDPSEFYLAVTPIGSGNDWIKSFKVPSDHLAVADLVANAKFAKQDMAKVTLADGKVSYMANIGGAGFDSGVCVIVNREKEHGKRSKLIYVEALLRTILTLKVFSARYIADGETIYEGPCFSFALGNGAYSGGGMLQTSLANPADGLLDVMIVPKISVAKIIREIPRIFKGTVHESSVIIYRQFKQLEVIPLDSASVQPVEVDGEIEGNLPLKVEIQERQINVLSGE